MPVRYLGVTGELQGQREETFSDVPNLSCVIRVGLWIYGGRKAYTESGSWQLVVNRSTPKHPRHEGREVHSFLQGAAVMTLTPVFRGHLLLRLLQISFCSSLFV